VGGRVYTVRSPFQEGLYLDVGAMRIPDVHYLTLEYIRKFGLPIHPFINSLPNDLIYANGIKTRYQDYLRNPDLLRYPVNKRERGKTIEQLAKYVMDPAVQFIRKDPNGIGRSPSNDLISIPLNPFSVRIHSEDHFPPVRLK
jgi:monoamine oxidase